jgi:iron complex outermembrane recepter protein
MRIAVAATAVCFSIIGLATADDAKASIRNPTHIAAQPLGPALKELAQSLGLQVLYFSETVRDLRTRGAAGSLTPDEAFDQVLSGTDLTYRYLDDKTITILPVSSARDEGTPASPREQSAADGGGAAVADNGKEQVQKGFWDRFRLAQVDPGTSSGSAPVEKQTQQASRQQPIQLEEVLVTAQKRTERLQDVPVPVSAISAQTLVDSNQLRLQDYFSTMPNLDVSPAITSSQFLSIRGITTGGFSTPTVGVTIDDVPYSGSRAFIGGNTIPDFDPSDLERVEVLRGPQGALYGASSMGGLIKYVTVDPSTDRLSGRVQVGSSSVKNGSGLGYGVRGSLNMPFSDTLAVRVSGFTREDPGYIDNPVSGENGVNESRASGGRLSALWRPSDTFSLKLSAMSQRVKGNGADYTETGSNGLGDLQQNNLPNTGWYDRKAQAYSGVLTAKLGKMTVVSDTGYNINSTVDSLDISTAPFFASVISTQRSEKFSQELRVSAPLGERFDGMAGGFYTHEASAPFNQTGYLTDPATGALGSQFFTIVLPAKFDEYAVFGNLTYKITDRLDIQMGGRESWITLNDHSVGSDSEIGSYDVVTRIKNNVFTYLVTPRFKLSPDLMVYARAASGYRSPETNIPDIVFRGLPSGSKPDKTENYEVGFKGEFLDHILSIDASLYYITWSNIQLTLISAPPGKLAITYKANGGDAKSEGLELSTTIRPLSGMTIGAWLTVGKAELTSDLPVTSTASGKSGDRLPDGAKVSGHISIDREFLLRSNLTGSVGTSVSYIGERLGVFGSTAAPERQVFPAYVKADVRASLGNEAWRGTFYINNVGDRRAVISGGVGSFPPNAFFYIQPRTYGLSLSKAF